MLTKATLDLINIIGTGGAALFWGWSALVRIPNLMDTPLSGNSSLTGVLQKVARLSAIGAACAAVSALAQFVLLQGWYV